MSAVFKPQLTIATTLYRSEMHILEFYKRCCDVLDRLDVRAEMLFIDDGSPDASAQVVHEIAGADDRVRLVRLTRNFGHTAARIAAMQLASGERVFLIDCDLEEQPEWLIDFMKVMNHSDADSVYGVQARRKGNLFEKITGSVFYRLVKSIGRVNIPANPVTARLMSRKYLDALLQFQEKDVFLADLWQRVGFHQISVPVLKRSTSPSTYTIGKKVNQFATALTSFSVAPLYGVSALGVAAAFLGFIALAYSLIRWVYEGSTVDSTEGWLSIIASIWIFGGATLFAIGLIGLYLSRVFIEVKDRPLYLVAHDEGGVG